MSALSNKREMKLMKCILGFSKVICRNNPARMWVGVVLNLKT